jgi:hypothetical protein
MDKASARRRSSLPNIASQTKRARTIDIQNNQILHQIPAQVAPVIALPVSSVVENTFIDELIPDLVFDDDLDMSPAEECTDGETTHQRNLWGNFKEIEASLASSVGRGRDQKPCVGHRKECGQPVRLVKVSLFR